MKKYPERARRSRTCVQCQKTQWVRKDNISDRCLSCAARERALKANEVKRQKRLVASCHHCKKDFFTNKSSIERVCFHYCSRKCFVSSCRVDRQCKQCNKTFTINKGAISGKTNSSGNYCSRDCYNKVLCKPDRINGRGSRWKFIRTEAIKRNPFCALCGTLSRLQVYHLVPYRITKDNSQTNLTPLCVKCHKHVENVTQDVERTGLPAEIMKLCFWSILKEQQLATKLKLKDLKGSDLWLR